MKHEAEKAALGSDSMQVILCGNCQCPTASVPVDTAAREDGWRGFRIEGVLDFSLTGILAKLSGILAENGIGIFAVSTYNTDYILVKAENLDRSLSVLESAGYEIAG